MRREKASRMARTLVEKEGSPVSLERSPATDSTCASVLVRVITLWRSASAFSGVSTAELMRRRSSAVAAALEASVATPVTSSPSRASLIIGWSSRAISSTRATSGFTSSMRWLALPAAANITSIPPRRSMLCASLVATLTRSSRFTPIAPSAEPRWHTSNPSLAHSLSSGLYCALLTGSRGVMSISVSAMSPLWFTSMSLLRGMTFASLLIFTFTSTFSKSERTSNTLPTFTPRTRTGVPTWIPHAIGNANVAW
mmetsp:Transcript_12474/g.41077  ORF Transcript_12474/g.41077 Transcript_12474/m.41077 type:complete len:254 (+) Transcript_12474:1011-1772(+)